MRRLTPQFSFICAHSNANARIAGPHANPNTYSDGYPEPNSKSHADPDTDTNAAASQSVCLCHH